MVVGCGSVASCLFPVVEWSVGPIALSRKISINLIVLGVEMSEEDSAEQRVRAKLRTDFIKIINNGFVGQQSDIVLYSGFRCESATFRGTDRDVLHFGVEGLNTPAGIVPAAKLRATDVHSVTVKLD